MIYRTGTQEKWGETAVYERCELGRTCITIAIIEKLDVDGETSQRHLWSTSGDRRLGWRETWGSGSSTTSCQTFSSGSLGSESLNIRGALLRYCDRINGKTRIKRIDVTPGKAVMTTVTAAVHTISDVRVHKGTRFTENERFMVGYLDSCYPNVTSKEASASNQQSKGGSTRQINRMYSFLINPARLSRAACLPACVQKIQHNDTQNLGDSFCFCAMWYFVISPPPLIAHPHGSPPLAPISIILLHHRKHVRRYQKNEEKNADSPFPMTFLLIRSVTWFGLCEVKAALNSCTMVVPKKEHLQLNVGVYTDEKGFVYEVKKRD